MKFVYGVYGAVSFWENNAFALDAAVRHGGRLWHPAAAQEFNSIDCFILLFIWILFYLLYLLFRFHFNQPDAVRKEEHFFPGPHGRCVLGLFCQKVVYRPVRTLNADFYRIGGQFL